MLGQLPSRYRVAIWLAGLLTSAVGGAWLVEVTPLPLLWAGGGLLGMLVGLLVVPIFLRLLVREPHSR